VAAATVGAVDLNPDLVATGYANSSEPQATRNRSLGDPRGIVWDSTGTLGWVTGMGSNNVAKITAVGGRLATIEVGAGPTGVALDEARIRVYVLNKFSGSVSTIDAASDAVLAEERFFDPTPLAVKRGRKHLYDTHRTSGLGQASCASCHIDGKKDRLAWDLGNPTGDLKVVHGDNIDYLMSPVVPTNSTTFHPMKGPMTTQTLQDIIGKEPLHWRGDRLGIEEFNGAFTGLLGDDQLLSAREMQEFEDFLASIWFPPNPFRSKTNALRTDVDLSHLNLHHEDPNTGAVTALTTGNAKRGLDLYMPTLGIRQDGLHCVTCHTNDVGIGADYGFDTTTNQWVPMPIGPHGEIHSMLNSADPNTQRPLKIPQVRDMHQKTGFDLLALRNTQGFGYTHDGAVDTISHFLSEIVFNHTPGNEVQDVADLSALMLSYSGSGMPKGDVSDPDVPPGPIGKNSHAGVGFQWTIRSSQLSSEDVLILTEMFAQEAAAPDDIAIVVKQNHPSGQSGWYHAGNFVMQSSVAAYSMPLVDLLNSIGPGKEATFLVVPDGTKVRIGVDRDADGWFDADEVRLGTDPVDPFSVPPGGLACTQSIPAAPTAAAATAIGPYTVNVTWVDASANETGFAIERAWSDSPQWELVGDVPAGVTAFVDDSVSSATGYLYRVRSFNCAGHSSRTTTPATTTPALGSVTSVHIHAIELNMYEIASGTGAYGTFQIVDDQGRNVAGVQVDIAVTGPTVGALTSTTNDQGQALFVMPETTVPNPSWTFSIVAVGAGDPTVFHDAGSDNETSESVP
ncbi:MAG: hypothetical protein KDB80_02085, partial [Planctomycetes bacterium]|nr:hypothetical protein [Planctomycetota bacterium]